MIFRQVSCNCFDHTMGPLKPRRLAMKIAPASVRSKVGQPEELQPPHGPVGRSEATDATLAELKIYTPNPGLGHLVSLVQQEPNVRAELVQQVKERLATGHYLTEFAAAQTAGAILESES